MTPKQKKIKKVKQAKKLLFEFNQPIRRDDRCGNNLDDTALCKIDKVSEAENLLDEFIKANRV